MNRELLPLVNFGLFAVLLIAACYLGCAAPVKMVGYPGPNTASISMEECQYYYQNVAVLGSLPAEGKYQEIGYIVTEQKTSSELMYTSDEKQIEAARKKACTWGADAIVVMGTEGNTGTTYSAWSGFQKNEQRTSRIIAIRFLK